MSAYDFMNPNDSDCENPVMVSISNDSTLLSE